MATSTKGYLRYLAICGIIAPVLFTILILVASSLRPSYNQVSQVISELGANGSPNAWIQNVNFILFGALFVAFVLGLHLGINGGRGSKISSILLMAFGLVAGIGAASSLAPRLTAQHLTFILLPKSSASFHFQLAR